MRVETLLRTLSERDGRLTYFARDVHAATVGSREHKDAIEKYYQEVDRWHRVRDGIVLRYARLEAENDALRDSLERVNAHRNELLARVESLEYELAAAMGEPVP